jgi:rsbT co-antagonist protein RsbR
MLIQPSSAPERGERIMPTKASRATKARAAKETSPPEFGSDEHFRLLVESVSDYAIVILDAKGIVTTWNKGAERIKGFQAEEIIGRHFSCFYPQEKIQAGSPERELEVAAQNGRIEDEGWRVRKDGSQFWANIVVTALRDKAGKLIGFGKVTRDLTERKQAEELQQRQIQLSGIIGSAMDAIITLDADQRIVLFNTAAEQMFGVPAAQALGSPVERFMPERFRSTHGDHIRRFSQSNVTKRSMGALGEIFGLRANGEEFPIEASISQVEAAGSKYYTVILRDITERKQAEATIARQAQEIIEVSTPVVQVWEGVIAAPLIGTLDSQRTEQFMERLLERIVETNSPVALVDITGVPTLDTQTAQHLVETVIAVRMLGAQVVLTGVRPALAQTLVHLGVDLSNVVTRSSLSAGLRVAFDALDLQVTSKNGGR